MTSINSQEDFLQALRDNPAWREAVRVQILGEELIQLPARFNAFVDQMTVFVEQMTTFVEDQKAFNQRMLKTKRLSTMLRKPSIPMLPLASTAWKAT